MAENVVTHREAMAKRIATRPEYREAHFDYVRQLEQVGSALAEHLKDGLHDDAYSLAGSPGLDLVEEWTTLIQTGAVAPREEQQ